MAVAFTLLVSILLIAAVVGWLYRQRLVNLLPSRETVSVLGLFVPLALLLAAPLMLEILLLLALANLLPHITYILAPFAAFILGVSCAKETGAPHIIQWRLPETASTP